VAKITFFSSRANDFEGIARRWQFKYSTYAWIRIITFLTGLVIVVFFVNQREALNAFLALTTTTLLFFTLVHYHNRIRYNRNQAKFLSIINKDEIKKLEGDFSSMDDGSELDVHDHPYASDLDIFGSSSVFQLVNRTSTDPGRAMVASWLLWRAPKEEIADRQKAVVELSKEVDWRQNFQATALHYKDDNPDLSGFYSWLKTPPQILGNIFYRWTKYIGPGLSIVAIAGFFVLSLSFYWFVLSLVLNGFLLYRILELAKSTGEQTSACIKSIKAFYQLMLMVEKKDFHSPYLIKLQTNLTDETTKASGRIRELNFILQLFDSRSNPLFFILDLIFLIDVHSLVLAEKWKEVNKKIVGVWIDTIARMEAICSFAGLYFAHDDYILPIFHEELTLEIKNGGHPMIKPGEVVRNDFGMSGKGKVVIITGSNMSGKSTFLRTLGVNMVLALAGGPVFADSASLPYVRIFSGMRSVDNLEEHISSFYAELKRIRQLLDILQDGKEPVVYLLDEVLKGTNSKDRHAGSEALISQLTNKNCMGLISTHDVELGNLEHHLDKILNFSFSSEIVQDEIIFDYRIRPGVCKSFNASKLMEKMGITKSDLC